MEPPAYWARLEFAFQAMGMVRNKRVQTRVFEFLAEIAPCRDDDAFLGGGAYVVIAQIIGYGGPREWGTKS
jgi:hypothetical protein